MPIFDPQRFLDAQADSYQAARAELAAGHKRTHWMWFIFPQLAGLGSSAMTRLYSLGGLAEAQDFLQHPVLGARLRECTALVSGLRGRTPLQIFGTPDDLKFHSSVSLFALADPRETVFRDALDRYFAGELDQRTVHLLKP